MGAAIGMISPFLQMGLQIAGAMSARSASNNMLSQARNSAQAQIDEYARQAEEARTEAQEDRSDRAREADREFGALHAALADGGGLGTVNLLRLVTEVGAAEGRDFDRITRMEKNRVASLKAGAVATKQEYEAKAQQVKAENRANLIGVLGSGVRILGGAVGGAYSPTGISSGSTYKG